jgi:hypothetical protein
LFAARASDAGQAFEEPFAVSRFEAEEDSSGNVFEYTMARAFRDLKLKETNQ